MIKRLFLASFLLRLGSLGFSQSKSIEIELVPLIRYDTYPQFTYPSSSVSTRTVKLSGLSWGIHPLVRIPVSQRLNAKFGIGFYKYNFNKVSQSVRGVGDFSNRIISYPEGSSTSVYTTNNYHYNSYLLVVGLEKSVYLHEKGKMLIGVDVYGFYTFSQVFRIDEMIDVKRSNDRFFGLSPMIKIGINRNFGKLSIAPSFGIPLITIWHKDNVFPLERSKDFRAKFARGLAVTVPVKYKF